MICIKTQHFSLHRLLLLAIGLWPYQRSKLIRLQLSLFFGILVSSIISQVTVFALAECTRDLSIKVLSTTLYLIMYTIKYNSFRINIQSIKQFLEELQHICNELEDENEIAIIQKYGNNAKRYAAIIVLFHLFCLTTIISLPILPLIPGIGLLINEFQPRRVIQNMMPVYFVNGDHYFYLRVLHMNAAIFIGGTAMVATGMMLVGYLKHACGMLRIASYRIEKAMMTNIGKNISLKDEIIIYKEIVNAVDIHRKAIKLSELIFLNIQTSHFLLIIVSVICLSLNLYEIAKALGDDAEQFLPHFFIVSDIFVYLFLANHIGQEIMDHNDHVFSTAYNVRWYAAPLHIQKLILFLLQRGSKTVNLNVGGILMLSLELFATLTKASISYFTVVYSM